MSGADGDRTRSLLADNQLLLPLELLRLESGWEESNLRPPASEAGALATALHPDGSRTRESNPFLLLTRQLLFLMSYFGLAGNRGIEPRPAGFGGPPEPSSSPLRLERWSRTIYLRVMNPPPRPSAFSSGVTNRTRTGTSGFTPRRSTR